MIVIVLRLTKADERAPFDELPVLTSCAHRSENGSFLRLLMSAYASLLFRLVDLSFSWHLIRADMDKKKNLEATREAGSNLFLRARLSRFNFFSLSLIFFDRRRRRSSSSSSIVFE